MIAMGVKPSDMGIEIYRCRYKVRSQILVKHSCMWRCLGVPLKRMVPEKLMAVLERVVINLVGFCMWAV